ncbi:hypothetical protein R6Q57_021737 [Mikania cordata]
MVFWKTTGKKSKLSALIKWDHFTKHADEHGKQRSKCIYCGANYGAQLKHSNTSNMRNHIYACKGNPSNRSNNQSNLALV